MRVIFILTVFFASSLCFAQGTYIPLGTPSMHMIDRFEIKSGRMATPYEFNTTTKAYQRHRIAGYVDSFNVVGANLSKQDYFNLAYLQADNFEFSNSESTKSKKSKWGMYKFKAGFYSVKDYDGFSLVANPVTLLQVGEETRYKQFARPIINIRGIELRGKISNKFGYYTRITDEIVQPVSWVRDFYEEYKALPSAGFLKAEPYDSPSVINYSRGTGYIVYQPIKQVDIQFGHGTNFLGNGYRTFYMSDFSREVLFLRVNTRVWKINYTNIWGELYDWLPFTQRRNPKRHYFATTYANINIGKNFNLGMFQTVSFQRDSGYANTGYDAQYLNPIIFFKPVENGLNSPDKTILGFDIKWNFLRHFQVYGQAVISEFIIEEMIHYKRGWFGNKWATQLGLKYIDAAGVKNLDIQLEANIARPYMYTSFNAQNAYVNFNQNMAHPLGANFYEYIGIVRYQPFNKLFVKATAILAIYGLDTPGFNYGKDIRLSYERTGINNYGNYITQGIRTTLVTTDIVASYMLRHNLFFDLQFQYRETKSELPLYDTRTVFINGTIHWNFAEKRWDF